MWQFTRGYPSTNHGNIPTQQILKFLSQDQIINQPSLSSLEQGFHHVSSVTWKKNKIIQLVGEHPPISLADLSSLTPCFWWWGMSTKLEHIPRRKVHHTQMVWERGIKTVWSAWAASDSPVYLGFVKRQTSSNQNKQKKSAWFIGPRDRHRHRHHRRRRRRPHHYHHHHNHQVTIPFNTNVY